MTTPSEAEIEAAARYLRDTTQAGKKLSPWPMVSNSSKKKWRVLAEGALKAAKEASQ